MAKLSTTEIGSMTPKQFRLIVRKGEWSDITIDACIGYVQASLVVLPADLAYDFLLFCNRNPRPCPLLEVTEPGNSHPKIMAPDADIRTDIPKYRVFKKGEIIDEPSDINKYWRDDLVGFLLGCGLTLVPLLRAANISWRRYGGYCSTIPCMPVGPFHGHIVVGVRAFYNTRDAVRAIQVYSRYPLFHGPPIHIGNPADIGITNIGEPDSFEPDRPFAKPPKPGEIVMSWAGAVTPQLIAVESKIPFMITHRPTHELVVDRLTEEMAVY